LSRGSTRAFGAAHHEDVFIFPHPEPSRSDESKDPFIESVVRHAMLRIAAHHEEVKQILILSRIAIAMRVEGRGSKRLTVFVVRASTRDAAHRGSP
jgi:hypothetical protein